jgi:hypothetical protein
VNPLPNQDDREWTRRRKKDKSSRGLTQMDVDEILGGTPWILSAFICGLFA